MKKVYVETPKFLNHLDTSRSKFFLSFGENVFAGLSKLLSMSPSEQFEEKKFLKKCFINSGLYEKNLKFDIKISEMLSNPNSTSPKHQFHRIFFWKLWCLSFSDFDQNIFGSWRTTSVSLNEMAIYEFK